MGKRNNDIISKYFTFGINAEEEKWPRVLAFREDFQCWVYKHGWMLGFVGATSPLTSPAMATGHELPLPRQQTRQAGALGPGPSHWVWLLPLV